MFDKIKRAISGWGQDSKPHSATLPRPSKKDSHGSKASHSQRDSLPTRFRHSLYRQTSSSSSDILPLPLSKDSRYTDAAAASPDSSPDPNSTPVAVPGPSLGASIDLASGSGLGHNLGHSPRRTILRASTFQDTALTPEDRAPVPQSPFIRRTSSFQGQKTKSDSDREERREEDIIIFSSTPPVTIARSSSVKIPRASSFHKGSPEQISGLPSSLSSLTDSPVVQWPRGGASSAANRSQEHFLRSHRRTSTSSDASLKDLQAQMATTPPISSSASQRPILERQYSRPGITSTAITTSTTTTVTSETHHTHTTITSNTHRKTPSDASAESNASTESHGASGAASAASCVTATGAVHSSGCASGHMHSSSQDPPHQIPANEHSRDIEAVKFTPTDSTPQLSPAVARQLAAGTQMLKISAKKQHSRLFKLDLEQGRILWDSRKFGRINVEQIKELRKGKAARMYREQLCVKPEHEERWLTIIYSAMGKYKALHLVAPTKDTYHDWIMAVERMWSDKREVTEGLPQLQRKTNQWLKEHWMDADKNVDSKLGYEEIVRLCYRLNINFSRKEIRLRFDQADEKKQGYLDFADFTHFVKLLKERKEVVRLFDRIAKNDSMTLDEFTHFMINTQKTSFDLEHIREIYGKHVDKTVDKYTVDSLTSFLLSVDNSVVAPQHAQVHQDMTQTLSNYYISSSHNTYLLGHQLTGISSIEGYIRALQSGCRCVELDCWDGSDGEPVIYHGRTLTSKILFRDVIEAISTYAFVNSPYPLILSLELHCDLQQQEKMASIMKNKLGSWLVLAPLDTDHANLPSPNDLKFKILVKSKVLPSNTVAQEYTTDTESESSERESESDSDSMKQKTKTKSKKVRIARALSDITVYCQSRHFSGFTHDGCQPYKIISFSERVSLRLAKQSLQEFINMNKSHLTRIYPAGFRINSTNYDPHHHWAAGSQVVALNYQSYDRGMQMNAAMFTMNGHCGYVLKPAPLRLKPDEACNHDKAPSFVKSHPVDVTLEIISAQQLPRPNEQQTGDVVDPVCEVELLIPGQSTVKVKTRHVSDNGFNPVWEESFKFRVDYEHHELVFFRFVVQDEDIKFSDLIASYCISLDSLQEGYRHIQLHDPSGDPYLYSTLFVKVSIVPVSASGYLSQVDGINTAAAAAALPPLPRLPNRSGEFRSSTESINDEQGASSSSEANDSSQSLTLADQTGYSERSLPPLPQLSGQSEQSSELPPLPPTPPPK
ncbi:Phospholipase C [Dissophora globulifera]|nr:Phospholipase C [Dissophora globulifera]